AVDGDCTNRLRRRDSIAPARQCRLGAVQLAARRGDALPGLARPARAGVVATTTVSGVRRRVDALPGAFQFARGAARATVAAGIARSDIRIVAYVAARSAVVPDNRCVERGNAPVPP